MELGVSIKTCKKKKAAYICYHSLEDTVSEKVYETINLVYQETQSHVGKPNNDEFWSVLASRKKYFFITVIMFPCSPPYTEKPK